MMNDLTPTFKLAVKNIRQMKMLITPSSEVLQLKRKPSLFTQEAESVVLKMYTFLVNPLVFTPNNNTILKLRDFIIKNMKDYRNADRFMFSCASKMTDEERDAIDMEVTSFAKICKVKIDELKAKTNYDPLTIRESSREAHELGVIAYLFENLQEVTKMIEEQQARRLEQIRSRNEKHTVLPRHKQDKLAGIELQALHDDDRIQSLPPEELEQLKQENELMETYLHHDFEEATKMERKIVEISQLMDQFTTTVMQQNDDIEHIHYSAIDSNVNITQGNQHLLKAHEHGSNCGLLMFCALILTSFLLLFLHWYS